MTMIMIIVLEIIIIFVAMTVMRFVVIVRRMRVKFIVQRKVMTRKVIVVGGTKSNCSIMCICMCVTGC